MLAAVATRKVRSLLTINQFGRSNMISTQLQCIEKDSPKQLLWNRISRNYQTTLFNISEYQASLSEVVLAPISVLQVVDPVLKEVAGNCFLSLSDFCESYSLRHFFLKTSQDFCLTTTVKHSPKLLPHLQKWGMWGVGNSETGTDMFPRTDSEFSWWAFTGDVRTIAPNPSKKSLSECLLGTAIKYKAADGDRIYDTESPCLRSLSNGAGSGAYKVRNYQNEEWAERPLLPIEAERLMGWEENSTATGITKDGDAIAISNTQRIKMLGNGIIPAEITEILTKLAPILKECHEEEIEDGK